MITDEDIVKVWESCVTVTEMKCGECPLRHLHYPFCQKEGARRALKLIERQKKEIERLNQTSPQVRIEIPHGVIYVDSYDDLDWFLDDARESAIREFAEELKANWRPDNFFGDRVVEVDTIDELAKNATKKTEKTEEIRKRTFVDILVGFTAKVLSALVKVQKKQKTKEGQKNGKRKTN